MIRGWLALVLLASCLQAHDGQTEVRGEQCATCHLDDFNVTSQPPHRENAFPESCGDCHKNTGWQPALEGLHPSEPKFPLTAQPHAKIKCLDCHELGSGPSKAGANTNCVRCHKLTLAVMAQHDGAKSAQGVAFQYSGDVKNFCFSCHPSGRITRHMASNPFRLSGPHKAYCVRCHDRALGDINNKDNTTCLRSGCHSLGKLNGEHEGATYGTLRDTGSPHFCLDSRCHPDGRKHDD